jgi:spermidine/putrescine transport system permease protein
MGLADGLLYTRTGIVIGYLAILTPFSTAALFVARRQVPAKYLDAGRDLGAGTSELIWSVVIPGMRAGLLVSILLTFLLAFTDVIVTDLVGGARVYTVASAILDYVRINDWGYASSAGIAALAGVAVMLGLFGSALRGASADAA